MQKKTEYSVLPLRNTVLFPNQIIPIYIGRKQSGLPSFKQADLSFDSDLLGDVRESVLNTISLDPKLKSKKGEYLRHLLYLFERDVAIKTLMAG